MAVQAGQRLGRFTLVRRLGRGGGGEAWEAVLVGPYGFTRSVALKLLSDRAPGRRDAEDLVREARIGALLQHPNLVATHEIAEADGVLFLAMELVEAPPSGSSRSGSCSEAPPSSTSASRPARASPTCTKPSSTASRWG